MCVLYVPITISFSRYFDKNIVPNDFVKKKNVTDGPIIIIIIINCRNNCIVV